MNMEYEELLFARDNLAGRWLDHIYFWVGLVLDYHLYFNQGNFTNGRGLSSIGQII